MYLSAVVRIKWVRAYEHEYTIPGRENSMSKGDRRPWNVKGEQTSGVNRMQGDLERDVGGEIGNTVRGPPMSWRAL